MAEKTHIDKIIEKKKSSTEHNEFELVLRFFGNELIAIKLAATNFSAKLVVYSIILLIFAFLIMEVFGLNTLLGYGDYSASYYDND